MWMASSVRFAKNAKVPLLLIHGRKDRRVDMIQAVDFYLAMKRNGNPVKMILYDLVGHSVKLSSCNDDRLVNIIEFANDPKAYLEKDDNEFYEEWLNSINASIKINKLSLNSLYGWALLFRSDDIN